jgi:hypothetical protein
MSERDERSERSERREGSEEVEPVETTAGRAGTRHRWLSREPLGVRVETTRAAAGTQPPGPGPQTGSWGSDTVGASVPPGSTTGEGAACR